MCNRCIFQMHEVAYAGVPQAILGPKIDVGRAPTGRNKPTWLIMAPPKGARDLCIPRVELNVYMCVTFIQFYTISLYNKCCNKCYFGLFLT